jgi:mRNA interferase HicA
MKRNELIQYIEYNGASFVREGRRHTIYKRNMHRSAIPRHSEIVEELARKICKDLFIPFPK